MHHHPCYIYYQRIFKVDKFEILEKYLLHLTILTPNCHMRECNSHNGGQVDSTTCETGRLLIRKHYYLRLDWFFKQALLFNRLNHIYSLVYSMQFYVHKYIAKMNKNIWLIENMKQHTTNNGLPKQSNDSIQRD